MPVNLTLVSIQFRGIAPCPDATIPLRRNPDVPPFSLPEWTAGHTDPSQSPVAFRLDRTRNGTVSARIGFASPVSQTVEVKAEDATGGNAIGSIPPFAVQLVAGTGTQLTVRLDAPRLTDPAQARVQAHNDSWRWYARPRGTGTWQPIAETQHRVYTVLGAPMLPWGIDDPDLFVWTDALDLACQWAAGAIDVDAAAGMVARGIYQLGEPSSRPGLRYCHCSYVQLTMVGGALVSVFGCIDLIRYLNSTAVTNAATVDCHDMACAVSTFANALGAALIQGKICLVGRQIHTNDVRLIGGKETSTCFGEHELAWGGSALDPDPVWDACLQVDGDSDPASPPHQFVVSTGMIFNGGLSLGYRDRFAIGDDAKRLIAPGCRDVSNNRKLATLRPAPRRTPHDAVSGEIPVDLRDFLTSLDVKPWRLLEWFENPLDANLLAYLTTVTLAPDSIEPRLHIDWYRCASVQLARDVLSAIHSLYAQPTEYSPVAGDGGFRTLDGGSHVFVRTNLVVGINNAGMEARPIGDVPRQIDATLLERFGQRTLIL
jgi:hypothetical protein